MSDYAQQTAARLRKSASSYARSSLIHVTSDDDRVRGTIDAGIAVEHMAKAFLATLHPALLADRTADLDTMLHLTGFGLLAKSDPHEIKTISGREACLRCARLVPGFNYSQAVDQTLFTVRNSGAHFALAPEDLARESARLMVRLLEPLLKALKVDAEDFWGDMESVAQTLLDEKASQASAAVEMKIAAASSRLEVRLAGLGDTERRLVLKALTARPYYQEDEEPYECPACGQDGVVTCELHDVGNPEFEYEDLDDGGFVELGGHVDQLAYAVRFDCGACGLAFDYDEMSAADMETAYPREPRDYDRSEMPDPF